MPDDHVDSALDEDGAPAAGAPEEVSHDDAAATTSDDETPAAAPASDDDGESRPGRRRRTPLWLETVLLLCVALAMALVIKTFFVQAFYIPSGSMEPGLIKNDRILVEKPSYWLGHEPSRGDIIVFKDPGGWLTAEDETPTSPLSKLLEKVGLYPSGGHLVKRVIGTPGDIIHCCTESGELEVNGKAIDEKGFVKQPQNCDGPMVSQCAHPWTAGPVPSGMLFVMGDNRSNSGDSSARLMTCRPRPSCAYVPEDDVVGRVFALVWPASRFRFFSRPSVFSTIPDHPPADLTTGTSGTSTN